MIARVSIDGSNGGGGVRFTLSRSRAALSADSSFAASCWHFFVSPRPRSPPAPLSNAILACASRSEPKLIKRGRSAARGQATLLRADALFSPIKILNSATPLDDSASRHRAQNNKREGCARRTRRRNRRRWRGRSERPRANHGNIMPQRPRAHHLSGVPAENDHWLRPRNRTYPSSSPSPFPFFCALM